MIFVETPRGGAFVIELEPRSDERGFFARTWCQREFAAHGLETRLVQASVSFNTKPGPCAACISGGAIRGSQGREMHNRRDL